MFFGGCINRFTALITNKADFFDYSVNISTCVYSYDFDPFLLTFSILFSQKYSIMEDSSSTLILSYQFIKFLYVSKISYQRFNLIMVDWWLRSYSNWYTFAKVILRKRQQ